MSEAINGSSFLDTLTIGDPMSQRQGVKCCPAIRESTDERYIVKILSIPASQVQLDALLLTGVYPTPAHALEYFRERAEEVLQEVEILNKLHAMEGFLPFTHAEVRKAKDAVGYQVYLISPYKRSLERQMQLEPLTHLGAVNLGLDLCAALAICRRAGYLYMDLKPGNVFVTPSQGYRIGDLGFISLKSLKYASYPEQYRSAYTAPEIADAMSSLNDRIDIYALGLILYQVYNNGELPAATDGGFAPPAYADYEIAEIILKACDPDPDKRWADPLQMGQAIVAYMQRNSINDTPIVPPPVELPPEPETVEEEQPEPPKEPETLEDVGAILDSLLEEMPTPEEVSEAETAVTEEPVLEDLPVATEEEAAQDPELDLSFMDGDAEDETVPTEESAAEIQEDQVSDEVQEILSRVDELISHELPEPAVAPDPIDIPFPAPITLPDNTEEPEADVEAEAAEDVPQDQISEENEESEADAAEVPVVSSEENTPSDDTSEEKKSDAESDDEDWADEDEDDEYGFSEYYSDNRRSRSKHPHLIRNLVIITASILLLAALITGGFLFYQHYYLQPVDALNIDGSVDSLTVVVDSAIRDELLTVVCTDTYGNTRSQEVLNGRTHFTNLTPNTQYRVQLHISGFHKLDGITSGNFTTAAQTEILNLSAVAGPEDGSVILSFAVNGPEADSWTVAYSTGNSPETTQSFTGHTVTITDLTVGCEYLFRLIPNDDQYLTGTWLLHYTAQQIVCAQELTIRSCADGTLVAVWNVPEGQDGQTWNVRCYNDNGYDETVTTTDTQAQFTGLDHTYGYTVEVTAVGMTQSASASVSANPITLTSFTATAEKNNVLNLNWSFNGEAPAEGWILDYTIDGGTPITVSCSEPSAQIDKYPGSKYEIDVRPVGEITCFGKHLSYEADPAVKFSNYGVSADDMSFYMCLTPKKENWDRFDVPAPDYKTSFEVGVKASFLVELWKKSQNSDDKVTITYIIRKESGEPVSLNSVDSTWDKMWNKKFCELDIPQMPETAGKYTVEIYFNDQRVTTEAFSVI